MKNKKNGPLMEMFSSDREYLAAVLISSLGAFARHDSELYGAFLPRALVIVKQLVDAANLTDAMLAKLTVDLSIASFVDERSPLVRRLRDLEQRTRGASECCDCVPCSRRDWETEDDENGLSASLAGDTRGDHDGAKSTISRSP